MKSKIQLHIIYFWYVSNKMEPSHYSLLALLAYVKNPELEIN